MIIMTYEEGVVSDGGQEVNMESMKKTGESSYCADLDPVSRNRYKQLINRYGGRDPYLMKMSEFSAETKDLPAIEAIDIANYLILQTSYYTKQQMKAYKSMEAYNFFISGWVHNLGNKLLHDGYCLVFARVSLSSFLCVKVLAASSRGYNVHKPWKQTRNKSERRR